ncbi:unnamed protein product, partial [Brenthis ino]
MILPIIVAMMVFIGNTLQAYLAPRCHPYSNRDIICQPSSTKVLDVPKPINNGRFERFEVVGRQWRLPQISPSRRHSLLYHEKYSKLKFEKQKRFIKFIPMMVFEALRVAVAAIRDRTT